jgi:hypothetical protein
VTPKPRVRTAVKEQVQSTVLDDLVVAPPENTYAPVNVYARVNTYAQVNTYSSASSYATAPPSGDDKASEIIQSANEYGARNHYGPRKGAPKQVRRTIIVIPPQRTGGRLFWVPSTDWEECFEEYEQYDVVWEVGDCPDFDDAAEAMTFQQDFEDHPERARVEAMPIDSVSKTFRPSLAMFYSDFNIPAMAGSVRELRQELVADPEWLMRHLDISDLRHIGAWAGWAGVPMHADVFDAIHKDSVNGLGAAALDYAGWQKPERFGELGQEVKTTLEELSDGWSMRLCPTDNFLFHEASLHPDSEQMALGNGRYSVRMRGRYVITGADYHSDPTGSVVAGWRSCWMEATGTPRDPFTAWNPEAA